MQAPRLRIVTGKGGVGKTTVASAIAVAEAKRGKRVLLAEVNGRDRASLLLGVEATGSRLTQVRPNLWLVDMNPRDTLREYVLLTFKFEAVYKAVFENRFVKHFLRLVPSLAELTMLGKIWYHERETEGGAPRFDVIVLDAPATGHALAMLRAPAAVQNTVPPGPLRDTAKQLDALLKDHKRSVVHIVTTPEEMPVNEAIEIEHEVTTNLGMFTGTAFINQRVSALPAPVVQAVAGDTSAIATTLALREDRRALGEENLERLPAHTLRDACSIPRIVTSDFGKAAIDAIADIVAAKLFGGAR